MVKIRKLKKTDLKEFCRNEFHYYKELKSDPRFGIGTYGKAVSKKSLSKMFKSLITNPNSTVLVARE